MSTPDLGTALVALEVHAAQGSRPEWNDTTWLALMREAGAAGRGDELLPALTPRQILLALDTTGTGPDRILRAAFPELTALVGRALYAHPQTLYRVLGPGTAADPALAGAIGLGAAWLLAHSAGGDFSVTTRGAPRLQSWEERVAHRRWALDLQHVS